MRFSLLFALAATLTVAAACQPMSKSNFAGKVRAPEFPAGTPWLNVSKPLTLNDLEGKIVLLDFWTYCCINCIHILPDLKRLEQEYPELVVIGVHSAKFDNEKDVENIRAAILRYGIEHPVLVDNDFILWRQYAIRAWPSFALIDPTGKVIGQTSGEGVYETIKPYIDGLIQEFAGRIDTTRRTFSLEKQRRGGMGLSFPGKLDIHSPTGRLLITDSNNNRIVVLNDKGVVLDVVGSGLEGKTDGPFAEATFFRPQGLVYDAAQDALFVADTENHLIRKADFKTRMVTTLAGTGQQSRGYLNSGQGTTFALNSPWDVALWNGDVYIAMAGPHQIWKMNPTTAKLDRFAGSGQEDIEDGPRLEAKLAQPSGLSVGSDGLYFADSEVSAVRRVDDKDVKTLVGEGLFEFGDVDGSFDGARLQHCIGVLWHDGMLYVADTYNHKIRVLNPKTRTVSTLVGTGRRGWADGPALQAELNEPNDIAFHNGNFYITDTNNGLLRIYDPSTKLLSTLDLQDPDGKLKPAQRPAVAFDGETVRLKPADVSSDATTVSLEITLPKGWHFNAEAPNRIGSTPVQLSDPRTIVGQLPLSGTDAAAEATLYFCPDGNCKLCYVRSIRFQTTVERKDKGTDKPIEYDLQPME